jgi:toxin ParE1/3/4
MIELDKLAKKDIRSAFKWYCRRNRRAADQFLIDLEEAYRYIDSQWEYCSSFHGDVRWYRLKKYPYMLIFRVTPNHIKVLAVGHNSRRTAFWSRRAK